MHCSRSCPSLYLVVLLAFLSLWPSLPGYAFGEEGHALTCRVAWRSLTPETKVWLKNILDSRRRSAFEEACTWPDGPGKSHAAYAWLWPLHYVGVPLDAAMPDPTEHCAKRGCILSALPRFHQTLSSPDALLGDQQLALRMLVHLIADLHLPVHISHVDGRGGTMTRVRVAAPAITNDGNADVADSSSFSAPPDVLSSMIWNEHMLWDSGYLVAWLGNAQNDADFWASLATDVSPRPMDATAVHQWAAESFALAKQKELFATDTETPLSQSQVDHATEVVLERIRKAGYRIATTLNALAQHRASAQSVREKVGTATTDENGMR